MKFFQIYRKCQDYVTSQCLENTNLPFLFSGEVFSFRRDKLRNFPFQGSSKEELSIFSVQLATHFLLNTYIHLRKRRSAILNDWINLIEKHIQTSQQASLWIMDFLSDNGHQYLR